MTTPEANDQHAFNQPYTSDIVGVSNPYWAAFGPGVHLVCRSGEQAREAAAALNAAYLLGILSERIPVAVSQK